MGLAPFYFLHLLVSQIHSLTMRLHTPRCCLLLFLASATFLLAAADNASVPTEVIRSGLPVYIACHGGATGTEKNARGSLTVPLNRGLDILLTNPEAASTPSLWTSGSSWVPSGLVNKIVPVGSRRITAPVTEDGILGLALQQTISNNKRQFWFTPLALGKTIVSFDLVQASPQSGSYASSISSQKISFSVTVVAPVESSKGSRSAMRADGNSQ